MLLKNNVIYIEGEYRHVKKYSMSGLKNENVKKCRALGKVFKNAETTRFLYLKNAGEF